MRRAALALTAVLGAAAVIVAPLTAPRASAQTPIVSVIVDGTGNGHGRGLSQYGAFGRAISGQMYDQILGAYYGGTIPGDPVPSTQRIDVRLLALDNVADLKVISTSGAMSITGVPGVWGSVYALRVSVNNFQLWGSAAATDCNTDTAAFAPIVLPNPTPVVEFTTVGGDDVNTPAANVLGVCRPDGSVVHYRGTIEFWDTYAGNRAVNSVLVEQYVRGVVPREVPASWGAAPNGMEALKAQSVAARSYGLSQARNYFVETAGGSTRYASTCDSTSCQVYGGAAKRANGASPDVTVLEDPFTNAAVAATPGEVRRTSQSGTPVSTEFSSSNGPRTAGGSFPVVEDPADATPSNKLHRWTRVLDAATIAAKYGLGTLTSATMVEAADPQNQVYDGIWYNDVILTGTAGTKRVPAWTFRGDNGLPSPGFTLRTESSAGRPMGVNQRIELQVVGESVTAPDGSVDVIPSGVAAVALNVTAVTPSAGGYMTVWPCDAPRPEASNLNFAAGAVVANGVIAPVGANGKVCIFTNVSSHLLVDIAGWFDGSGSVVGATPRRLLDTRNAIGAPKARLRSGGTITLPMVGASMQRANGAPDTIPANATAVAINITAVTPSRAGYFTVWPCGSPRPEASNVNFTAGSVVANGVVASVGEGSICIFSDQESDVLVDVLGWFVPVGGLAPYVGAVPQRLVDTRNAIGGPTGVVTPSTPRSVPVRGVTLTVNGAAQQVPADASAVALNITMTQTQAGGYATVWPCGTTRPEASNVNFGPGSTVANGVIAPIGADGSVCVYTSANAHLIVDVAGWFTGGAAASFEGNVPKRLVDTRNAIGPAAVG